MAIQNLNEGTITGASQVPFYDTANGQDRRASLTEVAEVLESLGTTGASFVQYAAGVLAASTVLVTPAVDGGDVLLLLVPAGTLATLTVTLPNSAAAIHGQELLVHSTQIITALTVAANGALLVGGAPTAMTAGGFFRMRYDSVYRGWFRIG